MNFNNKDDVVLTFITDIQGAEPDILSSVYREDLYIKSLSDEVIEIIPAPKIGWTHKSLEASAVNINELAGEGADAYLGGVWVGSTEV